MPSSDKEVHLLAPADALAAISAVVQAALSAHGAQHSIIHELKRLKCMSSILREMRNGIASGRVPEPLHACLASMGRALAAVLGSSQLSLREGVGACMAELIALTGCFGIDDIAGMADAQSPSQTQSPAQEARVLYATLLHNFAKGVSELQQEKQSSDSADSAEAGPVAQPPAAQADDDGNEEYRSVAHAGFGLQFLIYSLKHCDVSRLRPALLPLLQPLFVLQDLAGPRLQKLAMEARSAYAFVKHLPVLPAQAPHVVASEVQTSASESWSCRGAALIHLQNFWFRHSFLLHGPLLAQLQVGSGAWSGGVVGMRVAPLLIPCLGAGKRHSCFSYSWKCRAFIEFIPSCLSKPISVRNLIIEVLPPAFRTL